MEPEKTKTDDNIPKRFPKDAVKEMAEYVLKDIFQDFKLDYSKSQEMIQFSTKALSFVLKENFSKYDFFVQVTLSEKIGQALLTASMCLWDPSTDDYATASYDSQDYIVIANIYGVWENK